MNTEDFYKETKPYLWNSDSWQKDEGFYGKEDMKRFAEEYHQAKLKELNIPDERGEGFYCGKHYYHCEGRCDQQCKDCEAETTK